MTTANTSPAPSRTPSVTPTPRSTATSTDAPASNVVQLPEDAIRDLASDVTGVQAWDGFSQFGPLAASVTDSGIVLFDLGRQEATKLYTTRRNERILALDMDGDTVVWAIGQYDVTTHRVPCDVSGGLDWRVVAYTISTGDQREIATGRNVTQVGCSAWATTAAVDGDLAVYTLESTDRTKWQIAVRSLATGEVVRTIDPGDGVVADLDAAAGAVAFTTGVPSDPSSPYVQLEQLRLMLSTQDAAQPRLVARGDGWGISFAGQRMAWGSDSGRAQCWTSTVADMNAIVIADDAGRGCSPQTSGDLVSYVTMTDASTTGNIWDARTMLTSHITPDVWLDTLSTNGGWLVWTGGTLGPIDTWVMQGLPISEVPGLTQ